MTKEKLTTLLVGATAVIAGLTPLVAGGKLLVAGELTAWIFFFYFVAGLVFILTGILILVGRKEAETVTTVLAIAHILAFVVFAGYIATGGKYEMHVFEVITSRTFMWSMLAFLFRILPS